MITALRHRLKRLCRFAAEDSGVAAIEFAMLVPILIFGCLALVDLGRAASERMTIGHAVRSVTMAASANATEQKIRDLFAEAAGDGYTVSNPSAEPDLEIDYSGNTRRIALAIERFCACRASLDAAVACTSTCSGEPVMRYYLIDAESEFQTILLPSFNLGVQTKVLIK